VAEPHVVDAPGPDTKAKKPKPLSLKDKIHRYGRQLTLEIALARAYHNLTRDQFLEVVGGSRDCVQAQLSTHNKWLDCWRIFPWLTCAAAGSKGSAFMRAFLTHFKTLSSAEQSQLIEGAVLSPVAGESGENQRHFQQLMTESRKTMKKDNSSEDNDLRSTPTIGLLDALLENQALFQEALRFAGNNPGRISNRFPLLYTFSMVRLITLIHQMMAEGLFNKVRLWFRLVPVCALQLALLATRSTPSACAHTRTRTQRLSPTHTLSLDFGLLEAHAPHTHIHPVVSTWMLTAAGLT
jgi:hypothetical protein